MAEWPFSACPLPDPWVCGKFFVLPFLLIFLDRTWWISRKPFSFQVNHVPHRWWFNPPRILFSLGQLHTFVGRPNLHVGWWYTTENDGFDAHNFWVRPGISTPYTAGNVVNQIIIIIMIIIIIINYPQYQDHQFYGWDSSKNGSFTIGFTRFMAVEVGHWRGWRGGQSYSERHPKAVEQAASGQWDEWWT